MKIPSPTGPRVKPTRQSLDYFRAATPDFSGIGRGLSALAAGLLGAQERVDARNAKTKRFKALIGFNDLERRTSDYMRKAQSDSTIDDTNFQDRVNTAYENFENEFISQIDPDLQEEFRVRSQELRNRVNAAGAEFQYKQQGRYADQRVGDELNQSAVQLESGGTFEMYEAMRDRVFELIESMDEPEAAQIERKREAERLLQTILYKRKQKLGETDIEGPGEITPGSHSDVISQAAAELGTDPLDLATVISYETLGKFSPSIWGGAGGNYLGLIQFGPEERARYGVRPDQSFSEQMTAVVSFLKDRGFKPGMGLLDLYSTILTGSPGNYDRRDQNGSVREHVAQMLLSAHRKKAAAVLGGMIIPDGIDSDPRFAAVPLEDRLSARADAQKELAAENAALISQATERYKTNYNDLLVRLHDGQAGQKDLDDFRDKNDGMDYRDINRAQGIIDERKKKDDFLRRGQGKLAAGELWDSTNNDDRKSADALIGPAGVERLSHGDQDYVSTVVLPYIDRMNFIPPTVAGTLSALTRVNDQKLVGFALDTLAEIRDRNPHAYAALPNLVRDDVSLWASIDGYVPDNQKFSVLRGGLDAKERAAYAGAREEARKILTDTKDPVDWPALAADKFEGWLSSPSIMGLPWAARAFANDLNAIFEVEYARDPNKERAIQRTLTRAAEHWGTFEFGGSFTLMKHPPPKVGYVPHLEGYKYMEHQARELFNLPNDVKMQLVSDEQTEREVEAWRAASGDARKKAVLPSYQLLIFKPDVNGIETWQVPDLKDAKGRPRRISFEITPEMTKLSEKIITYEQRKKEFENWMGRVYIPGVYTPKENPNVDFRLAVEDLNRQRAEREAELEQLKGRVEAQDKIAFRGKIDKQFIDRVINTTIETVLEPFGEYAAKPTTNKVIRPLFEDILRPAMRKIIDELKKLEPEEPPIESEPMPGTMEGFQ